MTEWGSAPVDMNAYLERIGLGGEAGAQRLEPTARTLVELHRAHVLAIPFENIDVLLGIRLDLSVEAIEHKLVRRRRGGVCHEHNLLFAMVLEQLGYAVRRVLTRVRDDGVALLPRGHSALLVEADGEQWLADLGYGSEGIIEPIPLSATTVQQGQWRFELERDGGTWRLRCGDPSGTVLYSLVDAEYRRPDFDVAAYFLLTHPASPFSGNLVVQRTTGDVRYALQGLDLTVERPDGQRSTEHVPPARLAEVLQGIFDITLSNDDIQAVNAFIDSRTVALDAALPTALVGQTR